MDVLLLFPPCRHLYEPSNAGSRPPSVPPLPSGTSCTEDLEFPNTPQHSTAAAAANSSKQPPVELELTSGPLPNGFHHQELSSSRISPFVLRDSSPGNDRSGGAAATVSQIRESDGVFNGGAVAGDQRWQSSVDEDETARLVSGQPAVQVSVLICDKSGLLSGHLQEMLECPLVCTQPCLTRLTSQRRVCKIIRMCYCHCTSSCWNIFYLWNE